MASHHLVSRFYSSSADRKRLCFSRISTSVNRWSANNLYPPFVEKNPSVAAACNGLMCLQYPDGMYLLWNPSTNEYKFLPPPDFEFPPCEDYEDHDISSTCTRFDFSYIRGLGFDAESGDYKFIKFSHISYSGEDGCIHSGLEQISVYSLEKNSWKVIPNSELYDITYGRAISVNGVCYWKTSNIVVAFDLATEKFSTFPFPVLLHNEYDSDLVEFDGSLALVIYSWYGITKLFRFWIMDVEDGVVVWIRKEKLDVCGVGARSPLGFCKNGCSFLLQGMDGALREYDYIARQLKSIDEIYGYPLHMNLFSYVESTVQLNGEEERTLERKRPRTKERPRGRQGFSSCGSIIHGIES